MSVQFISHKNEVLSEFQRKKKLALDLIGEAAEGHAKKNCPVGTPESTGIKGYVGGRLRNSIAHQTVGDTAYIGTDVEYAIWVEIKDVKHRTGKAHFLRDAATQHGDEYRSIAEAVLQE